MIKHRMPILHILMSPCMSVQFLTSFKGDACLKWQMGLVARKPNFGGFPRSEFQTSLLNYRD